MIIAIQAGTWIPVFWFKALWLCYEPFNLPATFWAFIIACCSSLRGAIVSKGSSTALQYDENKFLK